MPVTEDFNAVSTPVPKNYTLTAVNDHVLHAVTANQFGYAVNTVTFDFLNRLVIVVPASGDNRTFTFREFDEGSIEWHYNKMLALGMKPRPPDHIDGKPVALRPRNSMLNP